MSKAESYLRYIVNEIHTTIVATVDDEGLPVTAAIDMMDADENSLYFLTARGKSFFDRLKKRGFLALTALKGEDTKSSVAVSVRGQVREPDSHQMASVRSEAGGAGYLQLGFCRTGLVVPVHVPSDEQTCRQVSGPASATSVLDLLALSSD